MGTGECRDVCSNELFLARQYGGLLLVATALFWGRVMYRLNGTVGAIQKINNLSKETLPSSTKNDAETKWYLNSQRHVVAQDCVVAMLALFITYIANNVASENQDNYIFCLVDCRNAYDVD